MKRVAGLVIEEKKVAFMEYSDSRRLISSNSSQAWAWWSKAWTTFSPPSISLVKPVSSPRVSDCFRNMVKDFLEMKFASTKDRGLSSTTTRVIHGSMLSMKRMVPAMVATPVKSWVKPSSRPSENWSMSVTIRLIRSPEGWRST